MKCEGTNHPPLGHSPHGRHSLEPQLLFLRYFPPGHLSALAGACVLKSQTSRESSLTLAEFSTHLHCPCIATTIMVLSPEGSSFLVVLTVTCSEDAFYILT